MASVRCLSLAAAVAVVLGAGFAAVPASAGSRPPITTEGPAGPPARMANGTVASPPRLSSRTPGNGCPAAPYGPQYYAPAYPGYARTVALTFDDGPGKSTARILSILQSSGVAATFFNIGENMAARPALVREEARDGYTLGNHTWSHPDLTGLSRQAQRTQIDETTAEQRSITGTAPCVFRPPYGDYNSTTLSVASYRHLAVWLWSVDTEDWKADGSGSAYWVHRIERLAEQEGIELRHPVIIMHNQPGGNPATAAALPVIIRFFRAHHYRLVALTR